VLASVLAPDSADLGTLGAVAPKLEHSLHIGDLEVGVLGVVVSLTAAFATRGPADPRVAARATLLSDRVPSIA